MSRGVLVVVLVMAVVTLAPVVFAQAPGPPCDSALAVANAQKANAETIAANVLARLRVVEAEYEQLKAATAPKGAPKGEGPKKGDR